MSNFLGYAYNPNTRQVESAVFCDDHYGRHGYDVQFKDSNIYPETQLVLLKQESQGQWSITYRDASGRVRQDPKTGCDDFIGSFKLSEKSRNQATVRKASLDAVIAAFKAMVDESEGED